VPKTGNWQHPGRWVKPQQGGQAGAAATEGAQALNDAITADVGQPKSRESMMSLQNGIHAEMENLSFDDAQALSVAFTLYTRKKGTDQEKLAGDMLKNIVGNSPPPYEEEDRMKQQGGQVQSEQTPNWPEEVRDDYYAE
jgi:hypothetical protein